MCIAKLFEIDAMSYQIIACHVNYQIMLYMLHCVLSWCIVSSYVKSYGTLAIITTVCCYTSHLFMLLAHIIMLVCITILTYIAILA